METWQPDIHSDDNSLPGDLAGGAYISLRRIILMSIISAGFYWFYWMYRTWLQYRDHVYTVVIATGRQPSATVAAPGGQIHFPFWHGMTQAVPVYGFFRYHAHIRHYKALMQERGVADSLNLGLLTTIVVIAMLVRIIPHMLLEPNFFIAEVIFLIMETFVICHMQSNLNRYWADVDNRLAHPARFGKGEILLIILGVLFFWPGLIGTLIPGGLIQSLKS